MIPKKLFALAAIVFIATAVSVAASDEDESHPELFKTSETTIERLPASDQMVVEAGSEIRASVLCFKQAKMDCKEPTKKTCWVTSSPKGGAAQGLYSCACGCMESKR